jgi:hypothetical protein
MFAITVKAGALLSEITGWKLLLHENHKRTCTLKDKLAENSIYLYKWHYNCMSFWIYFKFVWHSLCLLLNYTRIFEPTALKVR